MHDPNSVMSSPSAMNWDIALGGFQDELFNERT